MITMNFNDVAAIPEHIDINKVLKKQPETEDIMSTCDGVDADELGRHLGISADTRKNLQKRSGNHLENILITWMREQETPLTWEKLIDVLIVMKRRDLVRKINDFLEKTRKFSKILKERRF